MSQTLEVLEIQQVLEHLPHRYPFLLIDRLEDIVPSESATGVKMVTINEPFFPGHFPGAPVMPGVLIIEAIAQSAAALVVHSLGDDGFGRLVYFMTIDKARFRKPVHPGSVLKLHVQKERQRRDVWRFAGTATVDGTTVAEAVISAMLLPKEAAEG
ncbi:3-hydroxyacyl-[acyl-carrier-protein] dehydratase FabZ [Rhodothalassium salexigens]|uniref:3-hydroxyacyl-ACP dehydratase FabZ n=1 Tax=Rhodothalassium salexigens TaxID=1086 RepID=UPI001913283D|nr:3-hydroxyacyl-ACP dehydratase FabZ [Rhodothalassium salexigens]MBK5911942.1 3-hydroxyacyl-[acyl-carrier-protein] dehydratase FabZ [Rhodothalassium salexigens]MBK5922106.1 3-hydroxyacyl-[acyl-carrier-protein] dehydratase FabZ [Rhodothalassium salexigens]